MSYSDNTDHLNAAKMIEALRYLESRISRIEEHIGSEKLESLNISSDFASLKTTGDAVVNDTGESSFESQVVEQGLAWMGSAVFLIGIIFLTNFTYNAGFTVLSELIGYFVAACIFALVYYLKKSSPHLVSVLKISGFLLIYYVTLRLHFFSSTPLITNKSIAFLLLVSVLAIQVYYSTRWKSEFLGLISIILGLLSALFYNSTHITLPVIAITAATSLFLLYRFSWWKLFVISMFLVYLAHILWYFNNPLTGQSIQVVESHQHNLVYLFLYGSIYVVSILYAQKKTISDSILVGIAILNALMFSGVLSMIVIKFYPDNYIWIFSLITVFCLSFSVYLKTQKIRLFAPAFYACCGFMAVSIAIYGYFGLPDGYLYLVLLSLLVVSMALWFRSRIIVVVNAFLYVIILLAYLINSDPVTIVDIAFAVVALGTARIMNWKKERLTLQTEMLRNFYLFIAFFMVLFGLYRSLPSQYVTLAWTSSAIIYFGLSVLLSNVKYRWMAIATFFFTGFHLLLVDLARLEVGYRVIAFLFFAVISIGVSIYYTRRIKKKADTD